MKVVNTTETEWQMGELHVVAPFQEVSEDGGELNKRLQKRQHYTFRRYRDCADLTVILSLSIDLYEKGTGLFFFPGGGAKNRVELPAYDADWLCTEESIVPAPEKTNFWRQSQTWEFFTAWTDYTLQTAPVQTIPEL